MNHCDLCGLDYYYEPKDHARVCQSRHDKAKQQMMNGLKMMQAGSTLSCAGCVLTVFGLIALIVVVGIVLSIGGH